MQMLREIGNNVWLIICSRWRTLKLTLMIKKNGKLFNLSEFMTTPIVLVYLFQTVWITSTASPCYHSIQIAFPWINPPNSNTAEIIRLYDAENSSKRKNRSLIRRSDWQYRVSKNHSIHRRNRKKKKKSKASQNEMNLYANFSKYVSSKVAEEARIFPRKLVGEMILTGARVYLLGIFIVFNIWLFDLQLAVHRRRCIGFVMFVYVYADLLGFRLRRHHRLNKCVEHDSR